jgi:Ni/Fe-hydrogenase subunit HybB-like protein
MATAISEDFLKIANASEPDNTGEDPRFRAPLVTGGKDFTAVTATVADLAERRTMPRAWYVCLAVSLMLLGLFGLMINYLVLTGVGVWGNNQPAGWGFGIVNFVFWVGIGHAGTLISAILYLFRQNWRTGINRMAEAMTIFAVMCAGVFPGIHVGRPWLAYWLFPIPNQMELWPQFRSPLLWDVFAVGTYATVSLLFWFVGMVPDIATFRDRSKGKIRQIVYGIFSLGWNGSARHWHRYERAYLLLAALATPLVLSVHSVVSFDFAVSQMPGWHTTIFPPYFVAGAIYGGFAMVLCLVIPARELFGLKDIITRRHVDNMAKVMLATGLIVAYAYGTEFFVAAYSGNPHEQFTFLNRVFGPYWWGWCIMTFCNVVTPQLMWSKRLRSKMWVVWVAAMCGNVGMWFERFEIIITSLTRDFLPSSWHAFVPTWVDLCTLAGSFGLFGTMFCLFCRFLPTVAMAEVKTIMPQAHAHGHDHDLGSDVHKTDYRPDEHHDPDKDAPRFANR